MYIQIVMSNNTQPPLPSFLADHAQWGPDGALGNDEASTVASSKDEVAAVDAALGLQLISIRLQRALITDLKAIAKHHGVAYQPLIRDLLNRFATSELNNILHSKLAEVERQQREHDAHGASPVAEFLERERKRA